ncbi:uncharacterized [Tachysurus ichikawai]
MKAALEKASEEKAGLEKEAVETAAQDQTDFRLSQPAHFAEVIDVRRIGSSAPHYVFRLPRLFSRVLL